MATRTVIATVQTVSQVFPPGTIEGAYTFALMNSGGSVLSSETGSNPSVSFPLVPVGPGYSISATKNGVTATVTFDVVAADGSIDVPQSVTIVQA